MSDVPSDLKYTAEHEWVRISDNSQTVRVGITDYAQGALGDVVYVSLPELGAKVAAGAACGEIESTKSVSDLYAPVGGTVTARNDALDDTPELINSDPYGAGWIIEIELAGDSSGDSSGDGASAVDALLDASAYGTLAG